jgi:hypothetical protein
MIDWLTRAADNGAFAGRTRREGVAMNWAELQADWQRAGVLLKTYWPKFTSEDLEWIGGRRDRLTARLAGLYGLDADEAERAVAAFEKEVRFPGAVK